jgi:ligand-binding sensor domain-containing protein
MYSHSTILIIAIVLSAISTPATSRPVGLDQYQITFEQIPSPHFGRVNAIIRDDRGFLWFGTSKGLCKYDGYQVRVFAIGSPQDIEQQIVTSMTRMDGDSLLLATGKGLWRFDLRAEHASPFLIGTEISQDRINAVTEDPDGTIWIGTGSLGLFSYNHTTLAVQRYTTSNGLSSNRILSLSFDRSGRLWIGTLDGGLNMLDRTTSRIVHYRSSVTDPGTLYSDNITALCENDNQELWIGTTEGLNVLHLKTRRMLRMDLHSYTKHSIMSLAHDPSGRMWIAALDLGLLFYANGSFTQFTRSDDVGRSLSSVRALYPDPVATTGRNLLLWIGTRSGVNKVSMSTNFFTNHIRNQDSLLLNRGAVLSLCEDRKGILWAGLWGGGLDALRRVHGMYRRIANFRKAGSQLPSLPNNDVGAVTEDRTGILWIGTAGGLAMLDKGRKQMVVYKHVGADSTSLVNNNVDRIFEDRSGTIWICTLGGLSELIRGTPHRFRNYLLDPKEADPVEGKHVSDIFQDHRSNLWVATYGRGLNKLESDGTHVRFLHPQDSTGTQENWIYSIAEDHEGLLWLSTLAGLVSFDPESGKFTRHPIEQLHDAHIFGIYVDERNDLWLSTGIGLARFTPKIQTFARVDEKHGLSFTELRSGFCRNASGKLFVGGLDGFAEFDPDSISTTSYPPKIAITAFSVFEKELPGSTIAEGDVHFPHDQNFFSFSFAALDYANPSRNRFAYRMEGVDRDWVDAGTRNHVRYTHLDPGNYVFKVKGCNADNVWNESGTSVSITITPPFWQTWWFHILAIGCIGGTMYTTYRYRVRRLLELERLRLRIADDLHDDVGSNLSAIAMMSRSIQRAPGLTRATKGKLAEIYETAVLTSEGMKDLVWFINPENDTFNDLFLKMKDTASTLLAEIDLEFHAPQVGESKILPINFKRNVFLAFKEIITNIAKHAKASKANVRIALRDGVFSMILSDNGQGFDQKGTHNGNGLQSLQKRAQQIGGSCKITSVPGQGTTVTFSGAM